MVTNTYGIEIEYAHPSDDNKLLMEKLKNDRITNVSLKYDESVRVPLSARKSTKPNYCPCGCGSLLDDDDDTSGSELVTKIIRGTKKVEAFSQKISAFNRKQGMKFHIDEIDDLVGSTAGVIESYESNTGLHIHFGVDPFTLVPADYLRLFENVAKHEKTIALLSGRKENEYCKHIADVIVEMIDDLDNDGCVDISSAYDIDDLFTDRYNGLNVSNVFNARLLSGKGSVEHFDKPTIEFRYAHASITRSHSRFMRYFKYCKKIVDESITGNRKFHGKVVTFDGDALEFED